MMFRPPYRSLPLLLLVSGAPLSVLLTACSSTPPAKTAESDAKTDAKPRLQSQSSSVKPPYKGGGYYKDDGPGANPPAQLDTVPDAIPRNEPLHAFANNTYKVLGKTYTPLTSNVGYRQDGMASWYGRKFHGKATSSGEPYDMYAMTAAHPTLPIPSYARVTNSENGKHIVVRINDRGPFHDNRLIDLSYTAAYKLDILKGVTPVTVEAVLPEIAPDSFVARAAETLPEPVSQPVTVAATAAPATPEVIAVPTPAGATAPEFAYYLQIGAFSVQARADELLQQITPRLSRDFPGVMRLEVNGLYKVHAGPFGQETEADAAALKLRDDLGLKTFKVVSKASSLSAPSSATTVAAGSPPLSQASAPLTKPLATTTPAPATGNVYLQVAAVSSAAAAESLSQKIKIKYGAELPGVSQVQNGALYKVHLGPFATPEATEPWVQAYQNDFGVKPYRVLSAHLTAQ